ncbi:Asp23/Gls24 family envelope stress response protein [uncultured Selenomonas sp.]|uniref:Asp23/Gls24 family envelope stress response protein n=1 Tax=uncultured Selenomonas sp. TaxID=159275 RepID=UPI0028EC50CF|nr:Asp23/Gls24 family envelope stress response protein [uncultured Selenomonas sp.]
MDVIALVGPSGTGKSHRALWVAQKNGADAIIDDGILIKDGKVIGGTSAKKEKNRIMAVRRAIFVLPGHVSDVRRAIAESQPRRILILGTSENMVQKIAKALKIGSVSKIIRIEDIASKKDMELAQYHRLRRGEHIIPVPTIELKPHFSGYLIDPIKSLFKTSSSKRRRLGERSIVRPVFSYYGKLVIDDSVIKSIVHIVAEKLEEVYRVGTTHVKHLVNGDDDLGIMVTIEVVFSYGHAIAETMAALRKDLQVEIERMTGMVVHEIDILVKSLHVDKAIAARA